MLTSIYHYIVCSLGKHMFQLIVVIMFLFSLGACNKFVEIPMPSSELASPMVFEDLTTANAAVVDMYIQLRERVLATGQSGGISMLMGHYADELEPYGYGGLFEENYYLNNLTPSNISVQSLWNNSYSLIYSANAIIERLEQSANITGVDKNRLQGEAYFVRAYTHFYLANLFGQVPYVTTTDYRVNTRIARQSLPNIYQLIIDDLLQAKTLLTEDYRGQERIRPNKSVAGALLARVYLYAGNWELAEKEATEVIDHHLYTWVDDLDQVFLKSSTATLWQLIPNQTGFNTYEAQYFIFLSGPPPNRALNMVLVNAFEPGDKRKEHWIGTVTDGSENWYYPYKYKERASTSMSVEYSIIFRLEEMYFIRAEASARQDIFNVSRDDINKIRERAGLDPVTTDTREGLITDILQERRAELFTEQGHRWFDLKRTQMADTYLSGLKPGWSITDTLLPIPESEILINPLVGPQNPGYGN